MAKKVLIAGSHPLSYSLIKQYEAKGVLVELHKSMDTRDISINAYDELCLLTEVTENNKSEMDHCVIASLELLAINYDVEAHEGQRMKCHLLLQSNEMLNVLQRTDFCDIIRERFDVYPFTMDEVWCRKIFFDYEPITKHSQKTVHLVIFGMNEISEMLAIHAAHVAHYPNFTFDSKLRTRITLIDEQAETKSMQWIAQYHHLFDQCYYRVVMPDQKKMIQTFHKPDPLLSKSEGRPNVRDFIDIEWEFVQTSSTSPIMREKLVKWSAAYSNQLLTIAFCYEHDFRNLNEALLLPHDIYSSKTPLYVYMHDGSPLQQMKSHNTLSRFHSFGMIDQGYDIRLPLVQMAKMVNYVYDLCYHENDINWTGHLRFAPDINTERLEQLWQETSQMMRISNIFNAMTIASKMRSVGLKEDEWDKFYDIPQHDINLLAEVEHNRWCVERLIMGWRPCTAEEQRRVEENIQIKEELKSKKVHYDLRPYHDLRPDITGKPVTIYDLCLCSCLPLIARTFVKGEGGKS